MRLERVVNNFIRRVARSLAGVAISCTDSCVQLIAELLIKLGDQYSSSAIAVASPPPIHSVAMPRRLP